jgi:hypothetical protein
MADLERLNPAQLENALTEQGAFWPKSLSNAELSTLLACMEKLARRYPAVDQQSSVREYLADFEKLAIRSSLESVIEAFEELRINPAQEFFPKPDEVAREIQRQRDLKAEDIRLAARGKSLDEWNAHVAAIEEERKTPEYQAWARVRGILEPAEKTA